MSKGKENVQVGRKDDGSKKRWDLLPFECIEEVVDVIEFGARKYDVDNWKYLSGARDRFFSACMRHLISWKKGEKNDRETNISHLSHAMTNIAFLRWFELNKNSKFQSENKE